MSSHIVGLIVFGLACVALPFAAYAYLDLRQQLSQS